MRPRSAPAWLTPRARPCCLRRRIRLYCTGDAPNRRLCGPALAPSGGSRAPSPSGPKTDRTSASRPEREPAGAERARGELHFTDRSARPHHAERSGDGGAPRRLRGVRARHPPRAGPSRHCARAQGGKRHGRPNTAQHKAAEVRKLDRQGLNKSEIARRFGIGRTSVRRILDGCRRAPHYGRITYDARQSTSSLTTSQLDSSSRRSAISLPTRSSS